MDVEIDYTEKIRLFQNMSDNYNEEIALEYLERNDWNERKAVESYLKSNKKLNRQSIKNSNESESNQHYKLNQSNKGEVGYFSKVSSFLYSLLCNKRNDSDKENDINLNDIFELYPFKSKVYNDFLQKLKSKLGIIIIYKNEDVRVLNNIQSSIEMNENHYIIEILNNNYVMYLTSNSSMEGQSIINEYKLNMNKTNISIVNLNKFNKLNIIDSHNGTLNFESFQNMIIFNLDKKKEEKNNYNTNSDYIDENQPLSQAALINKQKVELERLEKDEENKKRKVKQEEELKKKERIEEEERIKKANQQKIASISLLPDEPSTEDGNSTLIIFRYPHSEERRQRRFLISDKIELLYIYVRSLGTDIFEESNEFEIITPFPMRIYKDMSKTLEDEKLYPNAVVQIREI